MGGEDAGSLPVVFADLFIFKIILFSAPSVSLTLAPGQAVSTQSRPGERVTQQMMPMAPELQKPQVWPAPLPVPAALLPGLLW